MVICRPGARSAIAAEVPAIPPPTMMIWNAGEEAILDGGGEDWEGEDCAEGEGFD